MTGLSYTTRFVTYYSSADKDAVGIPDIPKQLKSAGYTTISNGKIYHNVNDTLIHGVRFIAHQILEFI